MDRAGLLPRQVEVVEQPQHPILAVDDAEAGRDQPAQILGPPAAHAVALGVGPAQNQRLERRQLAVVEPGRTAALGAVAQPGDALGVEADDPVAQGLAVHPRRPRRLLAAHPVERVGQGDQPTRHPTVALLARQAAQLVRRDVLAQCQPCSHAHAPLPASPRSRLNHRPPHFTTRVSQNSAGLV
jgi:hypothetical protein